MATAMTEISVFKMFLLCRNTY